MQHSGPEIWRALFDEWRQLGRSVAFWWPPTSVPSWAAPAFALGALLALVVFAGVALASVATLVGALLAAHLLLERVFGVSIALAAR